MRRTILTGWESTGQVLPDDPTSIGRKLAGFSPTARIKPVAEDFATIANDPLVLCVVETDDALPQVLDLVREVNNGVAEFKVSVTQRDGPLLVDGKPLNVYDVWPQGQGKVPPDTLAISGAGTLIDIRKADDAADPPQYRAGDIYLTRDPTRAQLTPGNTLELTISAEIPAHPGTDANGDPIVIPAEPKQRKITIGVSDHDEPFTDWATAWPKIEGFLGRQVSPAKKARIEAMGLTRKQLAAEARKRDWLN